MGERSTRASVAEVVRRVVGSDFPLAIEAYDGSRHRPPSAPATLEIRSPEAMRRLLWAPGELGLARAYVEGEITVTGGLRRALALVGNMEPIFGPRTIAWLARHAGARAVVRPRPPAEEVRLRGRRHVRRRDRRAIEHHYDLSNELYRLILGPTMTYSCAVFPHEWTTLTEAQTAKHELVCRKLGLRPGMRLLDVGCGWGGLLVHAAERHGVSAVGITLSEAQASWARAEVQRRGLGDQVEVRLQDYRDLGSERFDAISSIGMVEHVGLSRLRLYFERLFSVLSPGGRLLNHGICSPPRRGRSKRSQFIDRYIFPDGELHDLGTVVGHMERAGFEQRHVESLREHYTRTLDAWAANLDAAWDHAVAIIGPRRARIWRLYLAACAAGFEGGRINVYQVLGVRQGVRGESGMPPRPTWDSPATDIDLREAVPSERSAQADATPAADRGSMPS